MTYSLNSMNWV